MRFRAVENDRAPEFPSEGQPGNEKDQLFARLEAIVCQQFLERWDGVDHVVAVDNIMGEHGSL